MKAEIEGRTTRNHTLLVVAFTAVLLLMGLMGLANGLFMSEGGRTGKSGTSLDLGCDDELGRADLAPLVPNGGFIPCEPWDVGTGVQGYVWRAPQPRAVLLLQHGINEYAQRYARDYDRLIPHLLAAGITVYAFDLWGHGHSPGAETVTDLRAAVGDHLAARRLLEMEGLPVVLLGHSLGSFVTASSVARDQSGLAGVILMSAPLPERAGLALRARINLIATLNPGGRVPGPGADPSGLSRLPEEIARAAADPLIHHKGTTNLIGATALALAGDNWEIFQHWRVPTLILHGTDDTRVDPSGSRRLFDTIAAEDKTLRLVEGGRHELLNDADRDDVLAFILNWLEERI